MNINQLWQFVHPRIKEFMGGHPGQVVLAGGSVLRAKVGKFNSKENDMDLFVSEELKHQLTEIIESINTWEEVEYEKGSAGKIGRMKMLTSEGMYDVVPCQDPIHYIKNRFDLSISQIWLDHRGQVKTTTAFEEAWKAKKIEITSLYDIYKTVSRVEKYRKLLPEFTGPTGWYSIDAHCHYYLFGSGVVRFLEQYEDRDGPHYLVYRSDHKTERIVDLAEAKAKVESICRKQMKTYARLKKKAA